MAKRSKITKRSKGPKKRSRRRGRTPRGNCGCHKGGSDDEPVETVITEEEAAPAAEEKPAEEAAPAEAAPAAEEAAKPAEEAKLAEADAEGKGTENLVGETVKSNDAPDPTEGSWLARIGGGLRSIIGGKRRRRSRRKRKSRKTKGKKKRSRKRKSRKKRKTRRRRK